MSDPGLLSEFEKLYAEISNTPRSDGSPDAFRWLLRDCGHWVKPDSLGDVCWSCERNADLWDFVLDHPDVFP